MSTWFIVVWRPPLLNKRHKFSYWAQAFSHLSSGVMLGVGVWRSGPQICNKIRFRAWLSSTNAWGGTCLTATYFILNRRWHNFPWACAARTNPNTWTSFTTLSITSTWLWAHFFQTISVTFNFNFEFRGLVFPSMPLHDGITKVLWLHYNRFEISGPDCFFHPNCTLYQHFTLFLARRTYLHIPLQRRANMFPGSVGGGGNENQPRRTPAASLKELATPGLHKDVTIS